MRERDVFYFGRAERATCLLDKHNSLPGASASPEPLKERERSLVTVLWMWSTGQRVTMTIHGDLLSLDSISPPCFLRASPNQQHVGTDTLYDTHTHSHTGEKKNLSKEEGPVRSHREVAHSPLDLPCRAHFYSNFFFFFYFYHQKSSRLLLLFSVISLTKNRFIQLYVSNHGEIEAARRKRKDPG